MAEGIRRELCEPSPGPGRSVSRHQSYRDRGLRRVEKRSVTGEADYANEIYVRYSEDNGKSWGEWIDRYAKTYHRKEGREMIWHRPETGVYNPVHGHYAAITLQRIFLGDHHDCYKRFWGNGEATWTDHTFLHVSTDLEQWTDELVTYEPGASFDPDRWAVDGYTHVNEAYAGSNLEVLPDGDIIFPICANVAACCRILGVDVREVFPSCPQIMHGLIVIRGHWNGRAYDLTPSRPVVISDLKSSRGCNEPLVLPIGGGRIIAVFRGSNVISEGFSTRIEEGTPAHKWFCFSDDGGKTFTEAVPWHFDDREVCYSPATISHFLRSSRNGRAYWFGNLTGHDTYGNSPRYPLVFAAVNEKTGFLEKMTLRVIDDRDPAVDSEKMQLSNFTLLEDRETGTIELDVTRLGANPDDFWGSSAYRYYIEVER
jgi:hypothetical protein